MHIRVVRFTDVDHERIDGIKARIDEAGGPPEGVDSTGVQFVFDKEQGTVVVIQHFESEEKMRASEAALEGMDPETTPGTRASVDRGEVVAEAKA
jgi:hypothetical protein